jgi:hypothetical protein
VVRLSDCLLQAGTRKSKKEDEVRLGRAKKCAGVTSGHVWRALVLHTANVKTGSQTRNAPFAKRSFVHAAPLQCCNAAIDLATDTIFYLIAFFKKSTMSPVRYL